MHRFTTSARRADWKFAAAGRDHRRWRRIAGGCARRGDKPPILYSDPSAAAAARMSPHGTPVQSPLGGASAGDFGPTAMTPVHNPASTRARRDRRSSRGANARAGCDAN